MKKTLFASLFVLLTAPFIYSQTAGTLTVSATTSTAGGNYAPKNIVAIWIEDNQGNFVKTLLAYAQTRKTHLNTWEASTTAAGSPYNTVDAITGATRSSHATRTCSWNGTNINGTLVADGTYRLRMELTDKNNTGNFSTFTFTKGINPENQAPANVPSFSSISVSWEPLPTGINDNPAAIECRIMPNPSSGVFKIEAEQILELQVRNLAGGLIYRGNVKTIDLSNQPDGIYYLSIITETGQTTKKIVKNGL